MDGTGLQPDSRPSAPPAAMPDAVLQAGEYPLWFRITGDGPILIETIEDAVFSAALIPWPHAPHIRFFLAQGNDLAMAVNQAGFICLSPARAGAVDGGVGLHFISGGEFWRQYTVGAFFLYEDKPAALLYRDDIFLDSDAPPPSPRLWTYNLYSAAPESLTVPSPDAFSPQDGWNMDVLRFNGGFWYFRTVNKTAARPEIQMLRSEDLSQAGEPISLGTFQTAARPEPFSAAPAPLREMLVGVLSEFAGGIVTVISPEFPGTRNFTGGEDTGRTFSGYYLNAPAHYPLLLVTDPRGTGLYAEPGNPIRRFRLPALPEGFIYTGIGLAGDTVFASWEEQDGYSIGAAGFMALRLTALID